MRSNDPRPQKKVEWEALMPLLSLDDEDDRRRRRDPGMVSRVHGENRTVGGWVSGRVGGSEGGRGGMGAWLRSGGLQLASL